MKNFTSNNSVHPTPAIPEGAFEFGANWTAFLASVDETRIEQSIQALRSMLGVKSLVGKRFLDLGCGSGLSSLAAYRLGADVVSIDYDPQCVACAETLRDRYASRASWSIARGSVLDEAAMESLGHVEVVYSWGVLHHTGNMREAIRIASERVAPGGRFFIAIYNDQGGASRRWLKIKQWYNRLPNGLRPFWVICVAGVYELRFAVVRALTLQNPLPFGDWKAKQADRGMSAWYDWVDWIGGLPFEVAKVEAIVVPLRREAFILENLKTVGSGWGCNEYVFSRQSSGEGET